MEQNFFEPDAHYESDGDVVLHHKWSPLSAPARVPDTESVCFDCNICLDSAQDPVVTLCGHLYCWPCIYKWLHVQSSSDPNQEDQTCPVCKTNISMSSLVPLYGRGMSSESGCKKPDLGIKIPRRPAPTGLNSTVTTPPTSNLNSSERLRPNFVHPQYQSLHRPQYFPHPYGGYTAMASTDLGGGAAMTSFFIPMIGTFGEMVAARIFGSSGTSFFAYPYPNSQPLMGRNNVRMRRRHEMQLEKSLNRVSIFLLCCIILCLLSF